MTSTGSATFGIFSLLLWDSLVINSTESTLGKSFCDVCYIANDDFFFSAIIFSIDSVTFLGIGTCFKLYECRFSFFGGGGGGGAGFFSNFGSGITTFFFAGGNLGSLGTCSPISPVYLPSWS